jgi:hypothetical protein
MSVPGVVYGSPIVEAPVGSQAVADEIVASMRGLRDLFPYGTMEQKKMIRLLADSIEPGPQKRVTKAYMRRSRCVQRTRGGF